MKTPPPRDLQLHASATRLPETNNNRLLFAAAVVIVALASGFKETAIVPPNLVWALSGLLLVIAVPVVFRYLKTEAGAPPVEHYFPAAMGVVVVAGLAAMIEDWRYYVLAVLTFGVAFYAATVLDRRRLLGGLKPGQLIVQEIVLGLSLAAGYLVVLSTQKENLVLKLAWIFVLTVLATYRAFRVLGHSMSPRRGFFFAVMVSQVVVFLATALSLYLERGPGTEGPEAVMLFLAWYINRGLIQHTVDETLSRQIFLEYAAFGAVLAYLFFASYHQPR